MIPVCIDIYLHDYLCCSSSEYRDEMCVSAALLYQATNKPGYRSDAIAFYNSYSPGRWAYDWDDKTMLCDVSSTDVRIIILWFFVVAIFKYF